MKEKTKAKPSLGSSSDEFTEALYKFLCNGKHGKSNLVFSGFSLHIVLGMAAIGARSTTRKEMLKGLKMKETEDTETMGGIYAATLNSFDAGNRPDYFTIAVASRVFCSNKLKLNPIYEVAMKTHFNSNVVSLNLDNAQAAAKKINGWVATTTKQKIKVLVDPDSLKKDCRFVLVNALYFKGLWEHKFKARCTKDEYFHLSSTKKVKVKMMNSTQPYAYEHLKDIKAQAVCLPYRGRRLSMIVVRPDDPDNGLVALQSWTFHKNGKSQIIQKLRYHGNIKLSLPRFKVEVTLDNEIQPALENLGMKSIFSEKLANFGGIPSPETPDPMFHVSAVFQKALIEVDEAGTVAVAASGMKRIGKCSGISAPPIVVIVDRPFYYQIVDHAHEDMVLFAGHCIDPTLKQ